MPSLYDFQKDAIKALLANRDTMVLVPTSGGKSLCYIGAALLRPGLCLVVSPLIALMRDQLSTLERLGIPAAALDSLQTPEQKKLTMERLSNEEIKVLFVSPERLSLASFREFMGRLNLSLVAVDEAHCVNQWGFDFRPDYARLGDYLSQISDCPKLALTATATVNDTNIMVASLGMADPVIVKKMATHEHLQLKVLRGKSQAEQLTFVLNTVLSLQGSGIIYAATRKSVHAIAKMLKEAGIDGVSIYHGGLSSEERWNHQNAFISGQSRLIVATNAFGMGIDKPDIRFVIHANMPGSVEQYAQEVGRAGRDGNGARAYLFYGSKDFFLQRYMIDQSFCDFELLDRMIVWFQSEMSQLPSAMQQAECVTMLSSKLKVEATKVQKAIDLLVREEILIRMDAYVDHQLGFDDRYPQTTSMLSFCEAILSVSSDVFCARMAKRKDERLLKLRAVHKMIKDGIEPKEYMKNYFS